MDASPNAPKISDYILDLERKLDDIFELKNTDHYVKIFFLEQKMMLINRLFKGLAVVLTVMVGIVIIWLLVNLVQSQLIISSAREGSSLSLARLYLFGLQAPKIELNFRLVFIASAVEIALFWLLVLLDVVSRHRGLIATLVLFIFVGIVVFIVYSQYASVF